MLSFDSVKLLSACFNEHLHWCSKKVHHHRIDTEALNLLQFIVLNEGQNEKFTRCIPTQARDE